MRTLLLSFFLLSLITFKSQTSVGIGIYPTGTETGLGFRLNKDKKLSLDARLTRANFYSSPGISSCVTELNAIYRIVFLEKVRFHVGLGARTDWNFSATHKVGAIVPVGVEAFPFHFQNAGLFFEVAPFYVTDQDSKYSAGFRTVAGLVFYFPKRSPAKDNP
jgi:hypothetical protein